MPLSKFFRTVQQASVSKFVCVYQMELSFSVKTLKSLTFCLLKIQVNYQIIDFSLYCIFFFFLESERIFGNGVCTFIILDSESRMNMKSW